MNAKPNPVMQPCSSSQVKAHGHCAATNTLCVEYASGGKYHYEGAFLGQLLLPSGKTFLEHAQAAKMLPAPKGEA